MSVLMRCSQFINLASGSKLVIGDELKSCTSTVQAATPFTLGNRTVTLIDTPGFDDTKISETDILKMIALYLSTTYVTYDVSDFTRSHLFKL